MAVPVVMPRQGQSVESCVITKWNKRVGERVEKGELLFSYETDKAVFDFESPEAGILLAIFTPEESDVPVLATVGVIGVEGESVESFRSLVSTETKPSEAPKPEFMEKTAVIPTGGVKASPRAKARAERDGVVLGDVSGSGPAGRIIERDVQAAAMAGRSSTRAASQQAGKRGPKSSTGTGIGGRIRVADLSETGAGARTGTKELRVIPFSSVRKRIAARMLASLQQSAQLTLHSSADATSLLSHRGKIKRSLEEGNRNQQQGDVNLNDMVVFVVSRVLLRHPRINAVVDGDQLISYFHAHVGVAIDTEKGLMVPTLENADEMSLDEISRTIRQLAAECRNQTVTPDRLQGGSFTVTNLGTLGIESFTPVLNYPQVGILGVNAVVDRCRRDEHGGCRPVPYMGLSLTFDHRALDGAPAARFLADVKLDMENFEKILGR